MKKKWITKIVPFALSAAILAGCQPKGGETGKIESPENPLDLKTASAEEITLPITSTPTELSVACILGAPMGKSSFSEIPLFGEMEKRTGIKMNFSHTTKEKMNLLFASNDLPDIIINYWDDGAEKKAYNDEQILRLDDLIAKYAPNYLQILKNDPALHAQIADADGFIYSFQFLRNDPNLRVFDGFMIRQDWMDKLGLEAPNNVEELYNVLKAIKEGDPNGNGEADEIPFIMESGNGLYHLCSWWGVGDFYIDDNGTLQSGWVQPEYKEMLMWLNKIYNEGLLDQDYAITDRNQFDTKVSNGQAAMWFGLAGGGLARLNTLMAPIDPEFKLSAVPWMQLEDGKRYNMNIEYLSPISGRMGLSISATCKDPVAAVKLADYAYSEEGGRLISFGIEGESYTMENGVPTYTELITNTPGKAMSEMLAQYTVASGYPFEQSPHYFDQYMSDVQKAAINVWKDCEISRIVPVLKHTDEELLIATTKFNEIKSYHDEMINKFIVGRESFDNYDNFIKTLENMGLNDVVKVKQDAYARYLATVEKATK